MQFSSSGRSSGRRPLLTRTPWRLAFASLLALPLLAGVTQAAASPAGTADTLRTAKGDLVTGDAATFAQALKAADRGGQIMVWLKETGTPRPTPEFLVNLQGSAPETIALATEAPGTPRRNTLGPASVRRESAEAVMRALANTGAMDVSRMEALPVLTLRLPEHTRTAAIQLLLHHPNVDYVSAVHAREAKLQAAPLGTNPVDAKHTIHKVPEAWNITRGSGARVGVLDSGFAREVYSGAFHDDGQNFGNYGIVPLGFVDDGCDSATANYGGCVPYDDYIGHGTAVAGVIGQNDNNKGLVGIAPLALTYSMKIVWDTHIHGYCGDNPFNESSYCNEDDDFVRAVNYAAYHRFDVLSMSIAGSFNSDVYRALATAYYSYNVFLVAATGNDVNAGPKEPASYDVVMGVGGVDGAGNNLYNTAARDVSAYTDPFSTGVASCVQGYYCDAGSPGRMGGVGGTSGATPIVGGIATLMRSANPNVTPSQMWQALVNTAEGPNKVVNAYAAITQLPLTVSISGPGHLTSSDYGTWTAVPGGGVGPYTYRWERNGYLASTTSSYSDYSYGMSFTLALYVTDSRGATASTSMYVTVESSTPCSSRDPNEICDV